ncbi:efflux RND transporter periplasmic adaptor subunit [Pandoraea sp. ISTKB]|uniref:efflux RND transporter periplasmic adaptor subunit n=1 Tax=Pandoraea sp. ISTKB TaxID=1586708 RepID=UPI000846DD4A|nr:efflux RND transporter periplasmic adaptor subunit [Pandoraea sp. ISTKB]ODP30764.1 efflux transporter periplasmic adaptor subunit [Pandoraea sp. ISTKB]
MKKNTVIYACAALFSASALLSVGYLGGRHFASASAQASASPSDAAAPDGKARRVLYWHDPMMPSQHFDKPGKSPFMDMQLMPVYADEADAGDGAGNGSGGVRIDAGLQQNLGIRYATVRRAEVAAGFDVVGATQFDESQADVVQSRVTGYIDRLYTNAPMQHVAQGTPVASLFVPDWLAPQEEFLALLHSGMNGGMNGALLDASRARMRALSIPETLIASLERTGQPQTHVVLSAPRAGVLTELNVRNGAMVSPGQTLAKVAGLSKLWLVVEIPEAMALRVRPGMKVDATLAADDAQHITGRVREILPGINPGSRTLQARLELDNSGERLTPGMLVRAHLSDAKPVSQLLVPSEAVITTGKRAVVIVRNADGRLQPVTVTTGSDTGADTAILAGLTEGQEVVASGQFLIDSEASLKSVLPKMSDAAAMPAASASSATSTTQTMPEMSGMASSAAEGDRQ